ncbi:putative septin-11 [Apostichopus japonicus]|uniref:Putative septin-11 n=1 Tax=Stichopus japonicus TaxID=307972 RepID=A0A2G8LLE8_STIJA|nr:putative septin-11 [Apostichopus japonicus]
MNGHLPFAVVGSTEEVKMGNKMVRARQYPWGVVQGKVLVVDALFQRCLEVALSGFLVEDRVPFESPICGKRESLRFCEITGDVGEDQHGGLD